MNAKQRLTKSAILLYAAVALLTSVYAYLRPDYDWDVLAYIGVVHMYEGHDAQTVHRMTYDDVKAKVSADEFEALTHSKDGYRAAVYADPEAFRQQLPFYTIKPLFNGLVFVLHQLGIPAMDAGMAVSITGYLTFCAVLFLCIRSYGGHPLVWLAGALFITCPPLFALSRMANPDMLSTCLIAIAFYLLLVRKSPAGFGAVMFLSVFARTDNLILTFTSLVLLTFLARKPYRMGRAPFVLFAAASVSAYAGINYFAGNYGWSTLFYHTFVQYMPYPAEYHGHIQPGEYVRQLLSGALSFKESYVSFFVLLAVFSAIVIARTERSKEKSMYLYAIWLLLLNIAARFMLFPIFWDRYFAGYYAVLAIIALGLAKPAAMAGAKSRDAEPPIRRRLEEAADEWTGTGPLPSRQSG